MTEHVGSGNHAGHLELERMLAFAHGESGADEAASVLDHGRRCRVCGDRLAVMLALAGTAVAREPLSPGFAGGSGAEAHRQSARRWHGAVAAAIVMALLTGAAMTAAWLRSSGPADEVAAVEPPGAGPATDLPAPGARLATTAPPDAVMLDFLFGEATPTAGGAAVRDGFALVIDRQYRQAVRRLTPLYEAQPLDGQVATALGIALYLSGDDGDEVERLLRQGGAMRLQDFSHLATWYLANLYLRRGDLVQARQVLEPLAQLTDDPGVRARALLERLQSEVR